MYAVFRAETLNRPWGWEVRFTGRASGQPDDPVQRAADRLARLNARLAEKEAIEAIRARVFDDLGPDILEALTWLITNIRKYPAATVTQAKTQWNATWSDSLFDFDRLATWMQKRAGNITWAQFKTYVIEHHFDFVDGAEE